MLHWKNLCFELYLLYMQKTPQENATALYIVNIIDFKMIAEKMN